MSKSTNPNTKRLATNCCACGRALRDAKSVEVGIGPHCRKKHGFDTTYNALTDSQRKSVNVLIHRAGIACEKNDIKLILKLAKKIERRGFSVVANRIRTRFVKIRIHRANGVDEYGWTPKRGGFKTGEQHDVVRVWTPYSPEFNGNRRDNRLRGRPCKEQTEFGKFHWEFKVEHSTLLMRVLALTFPGQSYLCDNGIFEVPTAAEFNSKFAGDSVAKIPLT